MCSNDEPCKQPMLRWVHSARCQEWVSQRRRIILLKTLLRSVVESPMSYDRRLEAARELDDGVLADSLRVPNTLLEEAREALGEDGRVEFDDNPPTSEGDDGIWVAGWFLVPGDEAEDG